MSRPSRRLWIAVLLAAIASLAFAALYDAEFSRALTNWPEAERAVFHALTRFGEADWILIPTLLVAAVAFLVRGLHLRYWTRWGVTAIGGISWYIFIGVGAPSLVATLLKRILGRARPMHLDELGPLSFQPLQWDWSLAGFPSGHATTSFALAVMLASLTGRKWHWLVFVLAGLIALSRVVTGMHYLTDVVAGAALGTFGALLVRDWFARRAFPVARDGNRVRNRTGAVMVRWARQAGSALRG